MEPVNQVPTIGQTQAAAAAVMADTVAELTRLAIDPALQPFVSNLEEIGRRWEECTDRMVNSARIVADHAQLLQAGQQQLAGSQEEAKARLDSAAAILRELAAASREQGNLLEAARVRDTTLEDRLGVFQDLNSQQDRQLAQLGAERAQLATTVRGALDTEHASLITTMEAQNAKLVGTVRITRLIVILGLVIVFAETLALALVILRHG